MFGYEGVIGVSALMGTKKSLNRVYTQINLSSAVKKILRGQQRELTARFIAFRSHWQYQAEFCTPGEGHEKGGVGGRSRLLPPQPLGSCAGGCRPSGVEPEAAGGLPRR